jgi:hypothetical protein
VFERLPGAPRADGLFLGSYTTTFVGVNTATRPLDRSKSSSRDPFDLRELAFSGSPDIGGVT